MELALDAAQDRSRQGFTRTRAHHSPAAPQAPHPLLAIQRHAGNLAVQQLLRDRTAAPVMRMPMAQSKGPDAEASGRALSQGQADGRNAKEACEQAKENCKSTLNCPPERIDVDKDCLCYRGGTFGTDGYICLSQCRCKADKFKNS